VWREAGAPPHLAADIAVAQLIAVCRRSKGSKPVTHAPCLALRAIAGANVACQIISAGAHACW
jgi:hypothetical protein